MTQMHVVIIFDHQPSQKCSLKLARFFNLKTSLTSFLKAKLHNLTLTCFNAGALMQLMHALGSNALAIILYYYILLPRALIESVRQH